MRGEQIGQRLRGEASIDRRRVIRAEQPLVPPDESAPDLGEHRSLGGGLRLSTAGRVKRRGARPHASLGGGERLAHRAKGAAHVPRLIDIMPVCGGPVRSRGRSPVAAR